MNTDAPTQKKPRKPRAKKQREPKPKKKPTPAARALYRKIKALADSGIAGEATAAKLKLERLCAKFDFSAPDDSCADIFNGCNFPRDPVAREVVTIPLADTELSTFVIGAIANGLHVETCIRQKPTDWTTQILAHVPLGSLIHLSKIAEHVTTSFRGAWQAFAKLPGVAAQDRGVFFRGLYDGMMNDARTGPLPTRQRPKTRRKSISAATTLHPYSIALDIGAKIRFAAPMEEISAIIDNHNPAVLAA